LTAASRAAVSEIGVRPVPPSALSALAAAAEMVWSDAMTIAARIPRDTSTRPVIAAEHERRMRAMTNSNPPPRRGAY